MRRLTIDPSRAPLPPPFPIIVGVPRSGTTLLRLMLDAHPDLAVPPETGFIAALIDAEHERPLDRAAVLQVITGFPTWPDFGLGADALRAAFDTMRPFSAADAVRLFYRLYASRFGKPRAGDKTPTYATRLLGIEALLPEAHFIHIIRDGRDVALSLRERWFAPARDMEALARYWVDMITACREQGARCRHYREVRYEELVERSRATLQGVCNFIALPYSSEMEHYYARARARLEEGQERRSPDGTLLVSKQERLMQQRRVLEPPDPDRIGFWRREMTTDERCEFESVAASFLAQEGYEV